MRDWLHDTVVFQREAFSTNVHALEGDAFADYAMYNLAALHDEVSEMSAEIGWKPWDTKRGWLNQQAVTDEAVDVLMFLGNILAAAGVTDHQIKQALAEKRAEVRDRQTSGDYTGRNNR